MTTSSPLLFSTGSIPLAGPLAFGISLTFACTASSRYSSLSFRLQQSELLVQQTSPLVGMVACIIVQIVLVSVQEAQVRIIRFAIKRSHMSSLTRQY